jgi:hypothetical protein
MADQRAGPGGPDLQTTEVHEALSNRRRLLVLEYLAERGGPRTARSLAEAIAVDETGEEPPPSNVQKSVYVALHQTHLPKLDGLGFIEYHERDKTAGLRPRGEVLIAYLEKVPKYGLPWSEYFVLVSLIGLVLIMAAAVDVPILSGLGVRGLATVTLCVLLGSAGYLGLLQRSSLVH